MRTIFVTFVLAAATAAALAQPAAAKEMEADLRTNAAGTTPGEPWNAVFSLVGVAEGKRFPIEGAAAGIEIRNEETGERRYYSARPASEAGVYRARGVFPSPGLWSIAVTDGMEIRIEFSPVPIARHPGETKSSSSNESSSVAGSFGSWPLAAAVALALAGAAAFVVFRYRPRIRGSRPA